MLGDGATMLLTGRDRDWVLESTMALDEPALALVGDGTNDSPALLVLTTYGRVYSLSFAASSGSAGRR